MTKKTEATVIITLKDGSELTMSPEYVKALEMSIKANDITYEYAVRVIREETEHFFKTKTIPTKFDHIKTWVGEMGGDLYMDKVEELNRMPQNKVDAFIARWKKQTKTDDFIDKWGNRCEIAMKWAKDEMKKPENIEKAQHRYKDHAELADRIIYLKIRPFYLGIIFAEMTGGEGTTLIIDPIDRSVAEVSKDGFISLKEKHDDDI
jgi:hypothetical protein